MRNLKKFLALVMAVLMLFGMAAIPTARRRTPIRIISKRRSSWRRFRS